MSLAVLFAASLSMQGPIDLNPVIWRTYKAGSYSSAETFKTVEMVTSGDFQTYARKFRPEGAGDAHDIDWGKEELVAVHLGTRNTGGFSVDVMSADHVSPTEVRVKFVEKTPPKSRTTTQALTSPWVIIRMNRPSARITFHGAKLENWVGGGQLVGVPNDNDSCGCCSACHTYGIPLPWDVYSYGNNSGALLPATTVIDGPEDLQDFARQNGVGRPDTRVRLDWSRDRLIAINLGSRMISGMRLAVDTVRVTRKGVTDVRLFEVRPGQLIEQLNNNQESPFIIVRVPRTGYKVSVTKVQVAAGQPLPYTYCDCDCGSCHNCRHRGE